MAASAGAPSQGGDPRKHTNLVQDRACGTCKVCCKLPDIPELSKPRDSWCERADLTPDRPGCSSYEERPEVCRSFRCGWLSGLGEAQDRPDKLGVMWQPITLPDGQPGIGVVEYRPGALQTERVMRSLTQFELRAPGRVLVRPAAQAMFSRVEVRVRGSSKKDWPKLEPKPGSAVGNRPAAANSPAGLASSAGH